MPKPLLDGTFGHKDDLVIRWATLLILVIFFVRGVTSVNSNYAIIWVGNNLIMELSEKIFSKLLSLPTRFYDKKNVFCRLIARLTFDVDQVQV